MAAVPIAKPPYTKYFAENEEPLDFAAVGFGLGLNCPSKTPTR